MKYIELVWAWITTSSADPTQTSLTVKSFLTGVVTLIAYGIGLTHIQLPVGWETDIVQTVLNVVMAIMGVVSSVTVLYGFIRKIALTAIGANAVVKQ